VVKKAPPILKPGAVGLMPLRNCWRGSCRQGLAGEHSRCCSSVSAGRWQKSRGVHVIPEVGSLYRRVHHAEVGVLPDAYAESLFGDTAGGVSPTLTTKARVRPTAGSDPAEPWSRVRWQGGVYAMAACSMRLQPPWLPLTPPYRRPRPSSADALTKPCYRRRTNQTL
jgi:hypothetical protein